MEQTNPANAQNTTQANADPINNAGQTTKEAAPAATPPATDPAPAKVAEPPKDAPKADVKFDLKASDGSPVDAAVAEKIVSFAKEHNLSPAQAQAIYNRENEALAAFTAEQETQYNTRKSQWVETIKKHPVIGGEHFEKNIQGAHLALKKFATPEFIKQLETTGLGNHPDLVEVFFNINKAMEDDKFVPAGRPADKKSLASVMYDKSK